MRFPALQWRTECQRHVTPRLAVTHPFLKCDALVVDQSGDGFMKDAPYSLMPPLKQRREREQRRHTEKKICGPYYESIAVVKQDSWGILN